MPQFRNFVYVVDAPGDELDGEDAVINATSKEDADAEASMLAKAWRTKLRYIGLKKAGLPNERFEFHVPKKALPSWAKEMLEDGRGAVVREVA